MGGHQEAALPGVIALVSLAVLLYTGFSYNVVFLYRILPLVGKRSFAIPFALIFNVPWALALWSYIAAGMSDPGRTPVRWVQFVQTVGENLPIYDSIHAWQPGKATHCGKCRIPRPERAHHCKICDSCIMRMDHHCPWINNCVGFNNHKFFPLLGLYGALAGIIACMTTLPEVVYVVLALVHYNGQTWQSTSDAIAFLLAAALGLAAAVLLSLLLTMHLPLALENCTTIEENYGKVGNPFNLGGGLANLEQVFGALGPDWLIPVRPLHPLTDGVAYPPFDDCFGSNILSSIESMPSEQVWTARYQVQPRRPPVVEPVMGGPPSWLPPFC